MNVRAFSAIKIFFYSRRKRIYGFNEKEILREKKLSVWKDASFDENRASRFKVYQVNLVVRKIVK